MQDNKKRQWYRGTAVERVRALKGFRNKYLVEPDESVFKWEMRINGKKRDIVTYIRNGNELKSIWNKKMFIV